MIQINEFRVIPNFTQYTLWKSSCSTICMCACLLCLFPQDSSDSEDDCGVHDGSRRKTLIEAIIDQVTETPHFGGLVWSITCVSNSTGHLDFRVLLSFSVLFL